MDLSAESTEEEEAEPSTQRSGRARKPIRKVQSQFRRQVAATAEVGAKRKEKKERQGDTQGFATKRVQFSVL